MDESIDILILDGMRKNPDIITLIEIYQKYYECQDIIFQYLSNFILENLTNDIIGIDSKRNFSGYLTCELLHVWVRGMNNDFVSGWLKTIEVMDNDSCYKILKKILKYSKLDCTFTPISFEINFQITELIWSVPKFRKVIKYFSNFVNGRDCMENDIFSSLEFNKKYDNTIVAYVESVRELIDDSETHESIINKILFTFDINKSLYTIGIVTMLNSAELENYANSYYTNFMYRVLIEIYKKYDINKITEKILESEDYEIDSHKINYTLPFEYKLMLCMMYSTYFEHFLGCTLLRTIESRINVREVEMFTKTLSRVCDIDYDVFYRFILNYERIIHKIHDQEFIFDILNYLGTTCESKALYGKLFKSHPHSIYNMIEKFIVNKYGKVQVNKHYRTDAVKIMLLIIKKQGYANFENYCDDLLLFINEVDYFADTSYIEMFSFHKEIVRTLMISIKDVKIDDKILSNILFKLLTRCGESFSVIDEILNQFPNGRRIPYELNGICCEIIGVINMTLYLYSEVFKVNKITNSYQELDREFAMLVSKITDECQLDHVNIHHKLKQPLLAKNLIDAVIDCIIIVKNTSILTYITECKDKLVKLINDPTFMIHESKRDEILKILSECKSDVIEYPDEFLDPLLCIPIKLPVMIPDIEDIFDRTTIVTRIKTDPINPYTRKPLTEEIFEEYNKKDEIKIKTNNFMEKFNEWKKRNNVL